MNNIIIKRCPKHGETEYILDKKYGAYHCKECRKDAVRDKRRRNKILLVEYKGGECEICGYNKCIDALEFHHKDPNQKDFGLGSGDTRSLEILKKEADKCILLCSNCHRELHANLRQKQILQKLTTVQQNKEEYIKSEEGMKRFSIPSEKDIPKILDLIDKGYINTDIARELNFALTTFRRFLKMHDITNGNSINKLTVLTVDMLKNDLTNLGNFSAIGKKYNVHGNSIKKWCAKHNLPIHLDKLKEYFKSEK